MQALLSDLRASSTAFLRSLFNEPIFVPLKISFGPATGYAATGNPHFKASIITIPKVSVLLGKTKTSEEAK